MQQQRRNSAKIRFGRSRESSPTDWPRHRAGFALGPPRMSSDQEESDDKDEEETVEHVDELKAAEPDGPAFYCLWFSLFLLAAAVILSIEENERELEIIERGGSEGGYERGRVAQAVFKGAEVSGMIVFREGDSHVPTKIVLGVAGLARGREFTWHIHDGAVEDAGACVTGRFVPGSPGITPGPGELTSAGQGWDMSKRHGVIAAMGHRADRERVAGEDEEEESAPDHEARSSSSLTAGVFFDPRLHLSGDRSVRAASSNWGRTAAPLSPVRVLLLLCSSLSSVCPRAATAVPMTPLSLVSLSQIVGNTVVIHDPLGGLAATSPCATIVLVQERQHEEREGRGGGARGEGADEEDTLTLEDEAQAVAPATEPLAEPVAPGDGLPEPGVNRTQQG
jgi:hypothetical protein